MGRNPVFKTTSEDVAEALPRHVFCPYYDDCLDEAVLKNQWFGCSQCFFQYPPAAKEQLDLTQSHKATKTQ